MKVLLLTDIPPSKNLTAGLVLEKLCRFLPSGDLAVFSVLPDTLQTDISPDMAALPSGRARRPRERAYRPLPGKLGDLPAYARETYHRLVSVRKVVDEAVAFARSWGAEAVWCVLEGQTQIRIALPVAETLGLPLYVQVWDPPGWWLRQNQVDQFSTRQIVDTFGRVLRRAKACAAVSQPMAEAYQAQYGAHCVTVPVGLDAALAKPPATAPNHAGELVIGMAGQLYADNEWKALIAALDQANWHVAGRKVRINLLGRYANLQATGPVNINFLGWADQADAIRIMAECDLLYCAYWFDPAFQEEARLSFPSKLTTYLAAGRPVFFHGPAYSSPAQFLASNDAGVLCHSLEPDRILNSLASVCENPELYRRLAVNGSAAFHRNLTLETMRSSFLEFLGLAVEA